jgi:hypothetical protein
MAKPWDDFESCAAEAADCMYNLDIKKGCAKTCGECGAGGADGAGAGGSNDDFDYGADYYYNDDYNTAGAGGGGGGVSDNSDPDCNNAYETGAMAKPWSDFSSCEDEKPDCPYNEMIRQGCRMTCGECTPSARRLAAKSMGKKAASKAAEIARRRDTAVADRSKTGGCRHDGRKCSIRTPNMQHGFNYYKTATAAEGEAGGDRRRKLEACTPAEQADFDARYKCSPSHLRPGHDLTRWKDNMAKTDYHAPPTTGKVKVLFSWIGTLPQYSLRQDI